MNFFKQTTKKYELSDELKLLTSKEMERFESENAVSPEKKRFLAFSSVLFTQNVESSRILAMIRTDKKEPARVLDSGWDITEGEAAIDTAGRLSEGLVHTPYSDDVYRALIRGNKIKLWNKQNCTIEKLGLQKAFEATRNRVLNGVVQIEGELSEDDRRSIAGYFIRRVNNSLERYDEIAKELIDKLGYSKHEISKIKTLSAWDFGRTGFIVRFSWFLGLIDERTAWSYLKIAAENASHYYSSWREYLAAYTLGRAVGYGGDFQFIFDCLNFLINDPKSPLKEIDFKFNV
ncbi:MAG: DUF1266 domain-containing protein [Clostridiales bacterium]|nr:DUF1266 domain-containing protein [Clostridiales bacterium]